MSTTRLLKYSRESLKRDSGLSSQDADYSLLVKGHKIPLSEQEYETISNLLTALRQGKSVTVVPDETYMTTQQAAEVLNVSRPYLVKLLENDEIPFTKVGNRRKVLVKDLLAYKEQRDTERRQVIREFSASIYEDGLDELDYESVSQIINED
ncbi:helix-turn-helix domain-containing protein [Crocosphaera sp. XPORK-15E]|uniref:helix-turn-helix domain-containing protein n=1 Tax=Crocosphaera sp. XPORK-15E TaxID=3110247 RepID=UPI002B20C69C|nr:helix-turn-helix domain-containing protein [Crocosphaera sp. XPORK-15E]MEA5535295.1 helix-turn-helix domain-containing protein [Crocosphaera sp. XPORK-15E]